MKSISFSLLFTFGLFAVELDAGIPLPGTQTGQIHNSQQNGTQLKYLIGLPRNYGQIPKEWPLVIFLHGSGERGGDLLQVEKHGPPKLFAKSDFPFILVSPQCPEGARWSEEPVATALQTLLEELLRRYSIDPEHISLTGLSMGAQGVWHWATREPYRFSSLLPIAGRATPEWGEKIAHLPIWVFHGAKDTSNAISHSENIIKVIEEQGGDPLFTVYPEAKHDSWTETYNNPEVYEWMLAQTKQEPPPKEFKPLVAPRE